MTTHNTFTVMSSFLTAAIIAGAAIFIAVLYFDSSDAQVRFNEIDDCLVASSMVTTHQGGERTATTTEPIRDIYQACLNDKGIEIGE